MQNDYLPEPLGPVIMHESGSLNLKSPHMDGQAVITLLSPDTLPYSYPNSIDLVSTAG